VPVQTQPAQSHHGQQPYGGPQPAMGPPPGYGNGPGYAGQVPQPPGYAGAGPVPQGPQGGCTKKDPWQWSWATLPQQYKHNWMILGYNQQNWDDPGTYGISLLLRTCVQASLFLSCEI
jgi:hypothetical protein